MALPTVIFETNSDAIGILRGGERHKGQGTSARAVRWSPVEARWDRLLSSGGEQDKRKAPAFGPTGALPAGRDHRGIRDAALQQGLRAAYRTVIEEPVPDRLLALLKGLDGDGPRR